MISLMLQEPIFKGALRGVLGEYLTPVRPAELEDESVGSFISRRFNSSVADNLVSAFIHGIYAGDIYQLSIKSLFPQFWDAELRYDSLAESFFKPGPKNRIMRETDIRTLEHLEEMGHMTKSDRYEHAVQFTFRHGLSTLAKALEDNLRQSQRVQIKTGTEIRSISLDQTRGEMNVCVAFTICSCILSDVPEGRLVGWLERLLPRHQHPLRQGMCQGPSTDHSTVGGHPFRQRHGRQSLFR